MTILELIILVISLAAVALAIGYIRQRGQKSLAQLTEVYYDNESEQVPEVDIASELYDKDLRPIVIKEVKEVKSEFPIDKPKKKRKYYPKKPKTSI
jgi:hypothetical protein